MVTFRKFNDTRVSMGHMPLSHAEYYYLLTGKRITPATLFVDETIKGLQREIEILEDLKGELSGTADRTSTSQA